MAGTLIHNARIVNESGKPTLGWLLFCNGIIEATGKGAPKGIAADNVIDFEGDLLMPGMIDTHVHFREPGLTSKATIKTESEAAVAGGVTSFIDMPNTIPPTVTLEAWADKMERASKNSLANYAFFIGATNSNLDSVIKQCDWSEVPGVKLFLGSSTGNLLVDSKESLERLFSETDALIAVHAEDNSRIADHSAIAREVFGEENEVSVDCHPVIRDAKACLDATLLAMELAGKYNHRLHLLHVSTAIETKLLRGGKPQWLTAETCAHYLHFSESDYEALGTRIKCNPSIKASTDRSALRKAVKDGIIDTIGSDHAPHLLSEKKGDALSAPSGMPGIQFQLPLLLDLYSPEVVARLTASNPAKIFNIDRRGSLKPGNYADMVRIRPDEHVISDSDVLSLCSWTPLDGSTVGHRVITTWVNGDCVYADGHVVRQSSVNSMPLKFNN